MKKIAFPGFVLVIFLLSSMKAYCAGPTAVEYNNKIIDEQTKIMKLILEFGNDESDDPAVMEGIRVRLVEQAEKSLAIVRKMPAFEGSTRLRDAAAGLFALYLDAGKTYYKEMLDIVSKGEGITEADLLRIEEIDKELTSKEESLDKEFELAQNEFARKHNFAIEENPLQNEIDELGN
jgi:hypothetical protein